MLCILIIFFYFENKVLVEQTYEDNNGKLKLNKYGNNQVISYSYDEFDRPSIINKMDKKYHYKYDTNGNISKIISDDSIQKNYYDSSKRLYRFKDDDFQIKYTYNKNDSIIEKNIF